MTSLSWKLEVYRLLNESTRPVGEKQPMLSEEEQREMRFWYVSGCSAQDFAELLIERDTEAADRVRSTSRAGTV